MLTREQYLERQRQANDSVYLPGLVAQRTKPVATPVVDSGDAMGSLASILGPSPEEKAAEEERMAAHKRKMQGWAGFFNGLRHLSNLHYAAKGAPGQQYQTNPNTLIEQQYEAERKRLNSMRDYERSYNQGMYTLKRQAEADKQKAELHKAQLDYYANRDANNAERLAIQRFNAETNAEYKQASLEQKEKILEIQQKLADGRINLMEAQEELAKVRSKNVGTSTSRKGSVGGYTTTTTETYDENGNKVRTTRRVPDDSTNTPPNGGSSSGRSNHRSNPFGGDDHRSNPFD